MAEGEGFEPQVPFSELACYQYLASGAIKTARISKTRLVVANFRVADHPPGMRRGMASVLVQARYKRLQDPC
jgi:hypothetical protein